MSEIESKWTVQEVTEQNDNQDYQDKIALENLAQLSFMNGKWEWVILVINCHEQYFLLIIGHYLPIYWSFLIRSSKCTYQNIIQTYSCTVNIFCFHLILFMHKNITVIITHTCIFF